MFADLRLLKHVRKRKYVRKFSILSTIPARLRALSRERCLLTRPTATQGTNSTRLSNNMGKELESWCSEKQRNKLLEQAMFPTLSHAAWVDEFVKYNTAIPSSAAVKSVIPWVGHHEGQESEYMTSDNFERLVFMKGNMDLLKMELSPEGTPKAKYSP
ncbi:hypothetical protein GWK47_017346 [Chionoecetes opilio]|uniref:Uncharacterized protein n=1 Tax=Chionoecetes opilio TaxID=41210 RepID=A0A8J4Y0A9_CHIOP|nr:hypothetical protein GWK47_017346 [Chionoecetes opilio]